MHVKLQQGGGQGDRGSLVDLGAAGTYDSTIELPDAVGLQTVASDGERTVWLDEREPDVAVAEFDVLLRQPGPRMTVSDSFPVRT